MISPNLKSTLFFFRNTIPVAFPWLILVVLFIRTDLAAAGTTQQGIRDISGLLDEKNQELDLPAAAAVVVQGDAIVAEGVTGVRRLGQDVEAIVDDRWHLGSCTKAMTATLIGILIEQGRLSWDTKITDALPDLAGVMRDEYRDVTIEMLLAHRGGITHEWEVPGLWDVLWRREGSAVVERRKMAEAVLAQPPKVPPGQYFYSNGGYGIAGHMAEVLVDKPWEELIQELVFEPLGMKSAGFGVPWEGEPPVEPWPHRGDRSPVPPGPFADNPPSIGPGGTVHASIGDWALFIIEHLTGARGEDGRLVNARTFSRLHSERSIGNEGTAYALGWMVLNRPWAKGDDPDDTGRCLHHAGTNNSWYSLVWIAPERDFAVLVTTNQGGVGVAGKIDAIIWAVIQDHISKI